MRKSAQAIANMVASSVLSTVNDELNQDKIVAMTSSAVVKAVKEEAEEDSSEDEDTSKPKKQKGPDDEQPEKQISPERIQRYIERGVEEVAGIVSDINFELEDNLKVSSAKVNGISFPEDDSAVIELTQVLTVGSEDVAKKIAPTARAFTLRPEFGKYVNYVITPPASMSPDCTLTVKIKVPASVVTAMLGGPARQNYTKSGKAMDTYAKKLLKFL